MAVFLHTFPEALSAPHFRPLTAAFHVNPSQWVPHGIQARKQSLEGSLLRRMLDGAPDRLFLLHPRAGLFPISPFLLPGSCFCSKASTRVMVTGGPEALGAGGLQQAAVGQGHTWWLRAGTDLLPDPKEALAALQGAEPPSQARGAPSLPPWVGSCPQPGSATNPEPPPELRPGGGLTLEMAMVK